MSFQESRRLLIFWLPSLLLAACNGDVTRSTEDGVFLPDAEIGGLELDARAPAVETLRSLYETADRTELGEGVVHYEFDVPVGSGPYEVVRLHRVVREDSPLRPIDTEGVVLMVGGSGQTFDAIFLRGGIDDPDARNAAPVYLAQHGIDVWGIDLSWTQIPDSVGDASFMQDWGVERDVDHTLAAMSVARLIRGLTRQGFGGMHLLGFSYGAMVAYAAAGRETQQPSADRDILGLIPVDAGLHAPNETVRQRACGNVENIRAQLAAGAYRTDIGGAVLLARFAATAPDDSSAAMPGLTNYQAALMVGTNPGAPWHFVAVDFNAAGVPVGLHYTDPHRWIRLFEKAGSMPVRANYDIVRVRCGEDDVSIDDHLAEIKVPILYLAAAGGFGPEEAKTAHMTASEDVVVHTISLQPPENRTRDFGHADLFVGRDAADLAWKVMRDWIMNHPSPASG